MRGTAELARLACGADGALAGMSTAAVRAAADGRSWFLYPISLLRGEEDPTQSLVAKLLRRLGLSAS